MANAQSLLTVKVSKFKQTVDFFCIKKLQNCLDFTWNAEWQKKMDYQKKSYF